MKNFFNYLCIGGNHDKTYFEENSSSCSGINDGLFHVYRMRQKWGDKRYGGENRSGRSDALLFERAVTGYQG